MNEAELLEDPTPATRGFLAGILHRLAVETGQNIEKRIGKALAPIATRLATVETRTGALAILAGNKGQAAPLPDDLQARLAKSDALVVSLEARASRHAEHLRALESRLKVLEHK